jgi:hypothetical protein
LPVAILIVVVISRCAVSCCPSRRCHRHRCCRPSPQESLPIEPPPWPS